MCRKKYRNCVFLFWFKACLCYDKLCDSSKRFVPTEERNDSLFKKILAFCIIGPFIYGRGSAPSKKEAEQEAAKNALDKLAKVD